MGAVKPCCESVERYYEDKISALESEVNRLRAEKVGDVATTPHPRCGLKEESRRLKENRRSFVCGCVGDDARDLLRFIADIFQARTIINDGILEAGTGQFPRWELMEDLLRNAVAHNPDAAAEMLVNILTHVGILDHGGNWLGSTTHGAHDKYLDELLGEGGS